MIARPRRTWYASVGDVRQTRRIKSTEGVGPRFRTHGGWNSHLIEAGTLVRIGRDQSSEPPKSRNAIYA
jgi:hypothetical protein